METEEIKNKKKKNKIPKDLFNSSKQTAIKILTFFPKAQIYPFNPNTFVCITGWEKHPGLTIDQIKSNKYKNVLYGLKMSSVPLVVLDFDIKSQDHPEGMTENTFKALKKEFGLNSYPCFSIGKSGKGGHFWFKQDKNTPTEESNMDFIQGLDYKINTIIFLSTYPFFTGLGDIQPLPKAFLDRKDQFRGHKPKKEGRFHKQQRTSYKALMDGDPKGIFESYRVARNEGQSQTQAFSVAGPTLLKLDTKTKKTNEKKFDDSLDNDPKKFKAYLNKLKNKLIQEIDNTKIIKPDFYDVDGIYPKIGTLIFVGATEEGKTSINLKALVLLIKEGKSVSIWEHSETNRQNRLNQWIKDNELKQYVDNGQLFMSYSRKEIIDRFKPGSIILIDDADSFLHIQKVIDRREVADALECLTLISQLIGCLVILCHFQSKTSKKETNIKSRSGGGASWVNKPRHCALVENVKTGKMIENTAGERREEERPILIIQKGYRPNHTEKSWWVNPDYSIGKPINSRLADQLIKDKAEGLDDLLFGVNKIVTDYMDDNNTNTMPTKEFYKTVAEIMGIKKTQAYTYITRLDRYELKRGGFGKPSYIAKKQK